MADKKDDDLFRRHRYINTQLIQATLQYEGRGVKYHSSDQDLEVGGLACHSSNRVVSMEARCRAVDRGVVHGAVQVGEMLSHTAGETTVVTNSFHCSSFNPHSSWPMATASTLVKGLGAVTSVTVM